MLKGREVSAFEFKSSSPANPFLWKYLLPAPASEVVAQLLGLIKGVLRSLSTQTTSWPRYAAATPVLRPT